MENLPSMSVTVPFVVPFSKMPAPMTGSPLSSMMVPLTVICSVWTVCACSSAARSPAGPEHRRPPDSSRTAMALPLNWMYLVFILVLD